MNNILKNSFYTTAWIFLTTQNNLITLASSSRDPGSTFWVNNANTTTWKLEDQTLWEALQTYVNYIMTFLYLIAVFYALWWWFLILTAAWDEEKVSKWKTILIQWGIWLLVIFLAWSIVKWILSILAS